MKSSESRWASYVQFITSWHCHVLLLLFCHFGCVFGEIVPELRRVMLGHSVQLACYPPSFVLPVDFHIVQWKKQGSPSPVLLWRKGQTNREGRGYEARVYLVDKASLSIVDLRSTDEGLYECQTWDVNGIQIGNNTYVELKVIGVIPMFVSQPRSVLMTPGGLVEFACATEPPPQTFRWQCNGHWLNSSNTTVISNGNLKIRVSQDKQMQLQQQGVYQCVVFWEDAALSSISANLTIAAILPREKQNTVTVSALEGGYAILAGFIPHSVPAAVPSVMHNGTVVPPISSRTMLLSSGNLHIYGVLASDAGLYEFSAMNPVTNETVASRAVVLQVARPDRQLPPQLLAAPEGVSVKVGSNITLECAVSGNPQPTILWTKFGSVLPVGKYQQVLGNLLLFDLHSNDSGTYICEAGNSAGHPVSAAATLEVYETPEIQQWIAEHEVHEIEELVLSCHTKGHFQPIISWFHNGSEVTDSENLILKGSNLMIQSAKRSHAGFYQCFASIGMETASAVARVRVVPLSTHTDDVSVVVAGHRTTHLLDRSWERSKNSTLAALDDSSDSPEEEDIRRPEKHKKNNKWKRKNKHKHGNGEGDRKVLMIPPTKPEVTKLSDESVMVRWNVPVNGGLSILFFKVQYKDVTKPHSSWMTIDEEIAPHILSYEVIGLKTGHVYRFRIAAVYTNNDNKLGPNSHKFTLQKDSPTKKPVIGPTIDHAKAISPSAITITWQYLDIDEVPIEGFFIYYRSTTSAGTYTKVTVLGATTSSHIISHLLPDTAYDIKMQCFNNAGTSDFSNIRTEKTLASPHALREGISENDKGVNELPQTSDTATSDQLLYTILGSVLGTLTVLLIVFVSYCSWKQRQRNRTQGIRSAHGKENGGSVIDQGKFLTINGSPANGHAGNVNGVLLWNKVRSGRPNDQQETSLSESPSTLLNNNYSEIPQDTQAGERDVDLESVQSDSEENPGDQTVTACKPLIHHAEDGYSSDENYEVLRDSLAAHPTSHGNQAMDAGAAEVSSS